MSKVDAQRAMREARFAALEAQAKGATRRTSARAAQDSPTETAPATERVSRRAATTTEPPAGTAPSPRRATTRGAAGTADGTEEPAAEADVERLCGHQSIGNKRCQRPAGHTEKNHRYK